MNLDKLKESIKIEERAGPNETTEFRAMLVVSTAVTVDNNAIPRYRQSLIDGMHDQIREQLTMGILFHLYEDRRKEVAEALTEFMRRFPVDSRWPEAKQKLWEQITHSPIPNHIKF